MQEGPRPLSQSGNGGGLEEGAAWEVDAERLADARDDLGDEEGVAPEVEEVLVQTKAKSNQDVLNYPIRLNNYLVALSGVVESADSAPTQASYDVFAMLSKQLDEQLDKWKQILSTDVPTYNDGVRKQDVPAIIVGKREEAGKEAGSQ